MEKIVLKKYVYSFTTNDDAPASDNVRTEYAFIASPTPQHEHFVESVKSRLKEHLVSFMSHYVLEFDPESSFSLPFDHLNNNLEVSE